MLTMPPYHFGPSKGMFHKVWGYVSGTRNSHFLLTKFQYVKTHPALSTPSNEHFITGMNQISKNSPLLALHNSSCNSMPGK